jgi:glycosyltransferase involved in cell wall biosynthesis
VLFKNSSYQIVHTHSSKAGILGRFAARASGVPLIIHTVHGWSFHDHMPASTRIMYILLERLTARISSALVCVSNKDIRKGLEKGIGRAEQYHLIRSAIPLDEFNLERFDRNAIKKELGFSPTDLVIGYVGRFSAQKDPLAWIKTAQRVIAEQADVKFLMVGDGPLRPQVEEALQNANLSDRTKLLGLRRDVPHLMSAVDILLLTSRWEGLPRTIPQAMALGIPVVAFQTDGIEEAVLHDKTGYLVGPGQWQELSAASVNLIRQPALRQAFGFQGQELARKEFDLRQMITKITNLYEMLLQDLPPGNLAT